MLRALPLVLVFVACRDQGARRTEPPPAMPRCGDGVIDDGEACDGSNLGDQTCRSVGFEAGQLTCGTDCQLVKTLCTRRCGNGTLDPGEACDADAGVPVCTTWGTNQCQDTCQLDTANCITQALEAAPELVSTYGGPAVIADLPPAGVPDLVMAVPSRNRIEIFAWNPVQGYSGTTSRKVDLGGQPVACVAGELSGDGALDVAVVNESGRFEIYVSQGSTFTLRSADAGCAGAAFAGVVRQSPSRQAAVAIGCGAAFIFDTGGTRRVSLPDAGAVGVSDVTGDGLDDLLVSDDRGEQVAIGPGPGLEPDGGLAFGVRASRLAAADLDGDGDADLAAIVGNDVKLYENTGAALAEKLVFAAPRAFSVELKDFDLDGLPDVVFTASDDVVVRRNRRGWAFSEFRQNVGAGDRLSMAVGDVDGDSDPDVVVTFSTGQFSTRSAVVRNRAR